MNQTKTGLAKSIRNRRRSRRVNLWTVARETHISTRVLGTIERGRFEELPHNVHTLGFVRRYAKFLGLDPTTAGRQYLEERGPLPKPTNKLRKQRVRSPIIGSRLMLVIVSIAVLAIIAIYLIWQVAILTTPPTLNVEQPSDNQLVTNRELTVKGKTIAGSVVSVNGQTVPTQSGEFSTTINLSDGLNIITIMSQNKRGKVSTVERSVLVQPEHN